MDASKAGSSSPGQLADVLQGATSNGIGFSKLSEGWGTEMIKGRGRDLEGGEMCEEKRVYYRVISGESERWCASMLELILQAYTRPSRSTSVTTTLINPQASGRQTSSASSPGWHPILNGSRMSTSTRCCCFERWLGRRRTSRHTTSVPVLPPRARWTSRAHSSVRKTSRPSRRSTRCCPWQRATECKRPSTRMTFSPGTMLE